MKRSEIKICGLDASIHPDELREAVATTGGCNKDEIKIGEIKKRSPRGMGAAWVQCPTTAAKAVADKGKIVVGWIAARVEVLKACPMTCFRCMERGHIASNCTSDNNRSNRCYNCGEPGHRARDCSATPKCPVCTDAGKPANGTKGTEATTEEAHPPRNAETVTERKGK